MHSLNIELRSNRLSLKPISQLYLDDFYEYSKITELYKFLEFKPFYNRSQSINYLNKLIDRSNGLDAQYWFICEKNTGRAIGTIGVYEINQVRKSAEIGYGISPKKWGNGFFGESLQLLLSFLFNKLMLHRVMAKTDKNNFASINALKAKEFLFEGTLKDFYFYPDSGWSDCEIYAILNRDVKKN